MTYLLQVTYCREQMANQPSILRDCPPDVIARVLEKIGDEER